VSAQGVETRATANLAQLGKAQLNDFFFGFNGFHNDLVHGFLRPVSKRFVLIGLQATRFSAD
jgi:hypothetical protein